MHAKKTLCIASVLLTDTLALTGCGANTNNTPIDNSGVSAGASASTGHNEAAQGPEIAKMSGWLNAWGETSRQRIWKGWPAWTTAVTRACPG